MYQSPRERANLVDIDEEEDDDEETIIDMRGKGGGAATSSFSPALTQDKLRGEPPARRPSGASSSQLPPPSPRRMSSPTAKLRPPPPSSSNDNLHSQQSHSIQVGQQETRAPSRSISSAPLMGKFQSVLTATTQVVNHLDTVADSVAEAMSLLQHPFGGSSNSHHHQHHQNRKAKDREAYNIESKLQEARDAHTRLKLLAFWQLLLTGFEVLKFAIGKRARKRVLWLALDGKLYLTHAKNDKKPNKCIFLADIYKVQKGSEAQSFTKSQSWRDARGSGKEQLCFSIHGNCGSRRQQRQQHQDGSGSSGGEKTFALQVRVASVRNVLVENLDALLRKTKSDADGEFPFVAQKVIAQQFAATGEVLSLYQVEDILLREEDEKNSGGSSAKEYSADNKSKSKRYSDSGFASGASAEGRGNGGGCDSSEDSDGSDRDDKRDILG